jgi:hypothetical protein
LPVLRQRVPGSARPVHAVIEQDPCDAWNNSAWENTAESSLAGSRKWSAFATVIGRAVDAKVLCGFALWRDIRVMNHQRRAFPFSLARRRHRSNAQPVVVLKG